MRTVIAIVAIGILGAATFALLSPPDDPTGARYGTGTGQVPVPGVGQVPRYAAVLLDASKTTEPVKAIVFEWQARPGAELVTARLEASDDLKTWTTIGSAPLVRLGGPEGRALLQPRVEFPPRPVKYLRATWDHEFEDAQEEVFARLQTLPDQEYAVPRERE